MPPKQGENKKGTKQKRMKFVEHIVEIDSSLKFISMPSQNEHGSSTVQTPPTYCAPFPTYPLPPRLVQTHPSYPTQNPSFPTLNQPLFHSPTPPTYITAPFPTPTTSAVHSHSPNYRSHVPTQYPSFPTHTQPLFPSSTPPTYITTPFPTPTTAVHSHSPNFRQRPLIPGPRSNPQGEFMNLLTSQPSAEVFMPVPTILNQEQQHELQHVQQEQEHEQDEGHQEDEEEEEEDDEQYIEHHARHPICNRFIIEPVGRGLEPNAVVAKYIRLAIQTNFKQFWVVYSDVDEKLIFGWFKKKCVWESRYDAQVEKKFHYRAQHRFSDMISTFRRKHAEKPEWFPKFIGDNIWPRLVDHWATYPKFKKRSQIGKVNRASEKGGCLHSGGSASSYTTGLRMKRTLGRLPFINELHKERHMKKGSHEYVDSRAKTTQEGFDERATKVLSQTDGSSPTGTMRSLDHSTAQTIWKETVGHGKSNKYYGAGTMSSNLVHNRCIYERSIDGEGSSRNVEMTPEMVALIQQLSQEMQSRNQVELEQVRTQNQKELEEMRTQFKQQQDFFMQEIRRNRELVEMMERRVAGQDRRRRTPLPQQDFANNESLSSKGGDDDDENSENG